MPLDFALIGVRAVHYASTVAVAGVLGFLCFVGEPAFGARTGETLPGIAALRMRLRRIAWLGLGVSIASAAAWLLLLSAGLTDSSAIEALSDGSALVVLADTQFGHNWQARFVLAAGLAAALWRLGRAAGPPALADVAIATALAACLLGALAWSGHSGATPGLRGGMQLLADFLHLVAAGAWIGALAPLALVLSMAGRTPAGQWPAVACEATVRFSKLGTAAVVTLAASGVVNSWVQVESAGALLQSQYGRLLLLKIAVFLSLLAVAGINRLRLTPLLLAGAGAATAGGPALRRLTRNCLIEIWLGLAVLAVVAVLGTVSPPVAAHAAPH